VRNLLERAKRSQALRLMELGGRRTREELSLLTLDDFEETLSELRNPPPPPPDSGRGGRRGGPSEGEEAAYA